MEPLLTVRNVVKHYRTGRGIVQAVDDCTFSVAKGETVGLVGESGCGKSTLGKTICRIIEPTTGSITLAGTDISKMSRRELRPLRKHIQFVFQDPFGSLNPRHSIGRILEEPLIVQNIGDASERKARVRRLLERVGLRADTANRLPHEFSGGQRQRIGIARALSLSPDLVVCDEPVSALDVSIQAQVLNLLVDLRREHGLSYVFVSHDLSVVRYMSDRVMIMYLGKIVEVASHVDIWSQPLHPYTRQLIASVPTARLERNRIPQLRRGNAQVPSVVSPPSGCRFRLCCPHAAEICSSLEPSLKDTGNGQLVACHFVQSPGAQSG